MIATIAKRFTFDAAHRLDRLPPDHKCHRMHGHTYEVELVFAGEVDENGFVLDYADIAKLWAPLHQLLDHRVLNEVDGLAIPSTEHLAAWVYARLYVKLPTTLYHKLVVVRVRESSTTWCEIKATDVSMDDIARFAPAASETNAL